MNEIGFVDTTIRDGQMSLWATNMTTAQMLPIAERLDRIGFEAIEIIAAAFFKKLVRDLKDDPWERLRLFAQRVRQTPLRAIRGRYMAAFQITPRAIAQLWLERLAAYGIRELRISDSSNTTALWGDHVRTAREVGLDPIVNLIFSVSPKHTDEYYAEKARAAAELDVIRICLKDPGGLLTPERVRSLVPVILQNVGGVPVELHTHCNTGLGPLCCLEAIQLGVRSLDVAIPPLSDASSNPSVFNVIENAAGMGYSHRLDEEGLRAVESYLDELARREGLPTGAPAHYDYNRYVHQVPGGMISNLRHQLSRMGMAEKLGAVLAETARVRKEFGYPIMVTPYSQFVGSQAAINVMTGERYKEVTDEVIQYAAGLWGEEESSSMDPDVRDRILDRPRAREVAAWRPPESSVAELRAAYGGPGVSDDELLLRYFAGVEPVAAMRAAGPSGVSVASENPILLLVRELAALTHWSSIEVSKGPLSLQVAREVAHEGGR